MASIAGPAAEAEELSPSLLVEVAHIGVDCMRVPLRRPEVREFPERILEVD